MTLLELLVKELPKRGGWPEGADLYCSYDGQAYAYADRGRVGVERSSLSTPEDLCETVMRGEYEAAIAASQQPVWDGDGLPTVGCRVKVTRGDVSWIERDEWMLGEIATIMANFKNDNDTNICAIQLSEGQCECIVSSCLVPMRTEAERKREEAIESLMRIVCSPSQSSAIVNKIYDTIAAGKIPGLMTQHHEPNPTYEKTIHCLVQNVIHADNLTAESLYSIIESGKIAGVKLGR